MWQLLHISDCLFLNAVFIDKKQHIKGIKYMVMEKITARTNDKIKHAVRLGESASLRKEAGEFFLEGARLCFDAVQTGIEIKQAFFTAKALWKYSEYTESIIAKSGICYEISAEVSQKRSGTENPQGVFCICAARNDV
jgi:TrmH family RNA methyltransferase